MWIKSLELKFQKNLQNIKNEFKIIPAFDSFHIEFLYQEQICMFYW